MEPGWRGVAGRKSLGTSEFRLEPTLPDHIASTATWGNTVYTVVFCTTHLSQRAETIIVNMRVAVDCLSATLKFNKFKV